MTTEIVVAEFLLFVSYSIFPFSFSLNPSSHPEGLKTTRSDLIETLASSLLHHEKFSSCSFLFFIHNNPIPKKSNPSSKFIDKLIESERDLFFVKVETDEDYEKIHRFKNSTNVRRFRDHCALGVFFLPSSSLDEESLYSQVIQGWTNIIKKDEDLYIFVSPYQRGNNDDMFRIYTSILGTGIKYKIWIAMEEEEEKESELKIYTTCIYCDAGQPSIVELKFGKGAIVTHANALYKDYTANFHGRIMTVGTPTGTGWIHEIRKISPGKWEAKRGIFKFVMDHIMLRLNFTCSIFPSFGNGGTGALLPNGTWLGTVGNIVYKISDLAHVTGQTWARNKMVGYTSPITYEMLTFSTGEPIRFYSWKAILWPLAAPVWVGLVVSFILGNAMMMYIVKKSGHEYDLTNVVSYTFASLFEQDVPSVEKIQLSALRIFSTFWLFFCLIVSTVYRSKLVSLLSFPNVEEPPKTFEELASSHDYKYALQYLHGAAYALLKTSPNPTYQTIFKNMELEEDEAKCFERVVGKKFVCISWAKIADYVARRNLSDPQGRVPVIKAPVTTCFLSVGIISEKRAVFLPNFNKIITRSTDSGLLEKWSEMDMDFVYKERRAWEMAVNKTPISWEEEGGSDTLTNKNMTGSYLLLSVGCWIAFLTFLVEKWTHKRKHGIVAVGSNHWTRWFIAIIRWGRRHV